MSMYGYEPPGFPGTTEVDSALTNLIADSNTFLELRSLDFGGMPSDEEELARDIIGIATSEAFLRILSAQQSLVRGEIPEDTRALATLVALGIHRRDRNRSSPDML